MALWRIATANGTAWARGAVGEGPVEMVDGTLDDFLGQANGLEDATRGPSAGRIPPGARVLTPIESQEVWAAGVTYLRSREARMEESGTPDHYDQVYVAERPELFFKAPGWRVRGPGEQIGIRADSTWNVPEPELGVIVDRRGEAVGYVVGNDVSSRSIEGENPLYLPQAKVYEGSCALGPCLVPMYEAPRLEDMLVTLRIYRSDAQVFADSIGMDQLRRTPEELIDWLYRAIEFPVGVVLLTGTGVVPGGDFTLEPDDEVAITIDGLGELRNTVKRVSGRRSTLG